MGLRCRSWRPVASERSRKTALRDHGCDQRKARWPECETNGVGMGAGGRTGRRGLRSCAAGDPGRETDGRWQTAIV